MSYDRLSSLGKRVLRALFWELAWQEDEYLESLVIAKFDGDTSNDLVIAQLDGVVSPTGRKIHRVTRHRVGKGRVHGQEDIG